MVNMPKVAAPTPEEKAMRYILMLSDVSRQSGMPNKAIKMLEDALLLQKTRPQLRGACHHMMSIIDRSLGNLVEAIDNAKQAVHLCACRETIENRGECYQAMREHLWSTESGDKEMMKYVSDQAVKDILGSERQPSMYHIDTLPEE